MALPNGYGGNQRVVILDRKNEKMDLQQFKQKLVQQLENKIEEQESVTIERIVRNNGVAVEGIAIDINDNGIKPLFFIDELYIDYINDQSLEDISDCMIYNYRDLGSVLSIVESYKDFDSICGRILFKLVNYDNNIEQLRDIPHRRFLDLAVVYYCSFDYPLKGRGNITIHNSHIRLWNVDEETLYNNAIANIPKLNKATINDMKTVLCSLIEEKNMQDIFNLDNLDSCYGDSTIEMYVLTNEERNLGASAIFHSDVLRKFALENETNYYILPSSIHEVLILPEYSVDINNVEELLGIVKEMNDTQVAREDILSYNIYYYNRKTDNVSIAEF